MIKQERRNLPDNDSPFHQPPVAKVGRMAARSAKWALLSMALRQTAMLGSTVIVARLITPGDTGVATIALTIMAFVVLLDTGLTWATVQPRDLSKAQIDGLFWLGVLIGGGLWGLCALSGAPLAAFFGVPPLAVVMPVIGLATFFNSLSTQPAALMKRRLQQKRVMLIESLGILIGSVTAIATALAGGGYWATVLQFVAIHATRTLLFASMTSYRPSAPQIPRASWHLARLGATFALSNYISFFQLYLGSLMVAKLFGAVDLGYYARANAVKVMPAQYATMVVTDVMVASLAALRADPDRMAAAYRKALGMTALVGCPAGAFIFAAAPELIGILYGPKWENAVPMLRAFGVAAVALPITTTTIWLFLATAQARTQLIMNAILTALIAIIFAVGAAVNRTATDFVLLESIVSATLLLGVNIIISHRAAGLPLSATLRVVLPIVAASKVAAATTILAVGAGGWLGEFWANITSAGIKAIVFTSTYACIMFLALILIPELVPIRNTLISAMGRQPPRQH